MVKIRVILFRDRNKGRMPASLLSYIVIAVLVIEAKQGRKKTESLERKKKIVIVCKLYDFFSPRNSQRIYKKQ